MVPDRDGLTDQTAVRNSGQHMQFFDLFAGLPRDPADCPSIIHRHALFFVRHLYVFRAAQCKSATYRARQRLRYWRAEYTQLCDFAPARDVMPQGAPKAAGIRARRPRSKLPYPLKPQGWCPPSRFRVAPLNGSHLLTHRSIPVAARRLAGPIARLLAAHLKKNSPPGFPIKQARDVSRKIRLRGKSSIATGCGFVMAARPMHPNAIKPARRRGAYGPHRRVEP
jgi:hypothetical protein